MEWDAIELQETEDIAGKPNAVSQDVYVKRSEDETWTVVNWQLSLHWGKWLTDSLTITE